MSQNPPCGGGSGPSRGHLSHPEMPSLQGREPQTEIGAVGCRGTWSFSLTRPPQFVMTNCPTGFSAGGASGGGKRTGCWPSRTRRTLASTKHLVPVPAPGLAPDAPGQALFIGQPLPQLRRVAHRGIPIALVGRPALVVAGLPGRLTGHNRSRGRPLRPACRPAQRQFSSSGSFLPVCRAAGSLPGALAAIAAAVSRASPVKRPLICTIPQPCCPR